MRNGSLRRLTQRRRSGRAEWLALSIAIAVHAVAFALVPGPLNNALRSAPEVLLSLNLEQPDLQNMDETDPPDATASEKGRGWSPSLPVVEAETGRGRGPAPTQNSAGQHGSLTPPNESAVNPVVAAESRPMPEEAAPDPAQVWAELGGALELRDAESDPEEAESAAVDEVAVEQAIAVEQQPAESPEPALDVDVDVEALLREYTIGIRRLIEERKFYPSQAERLGHSGTVKVGFIINAAGDVSGIYIKHGSGYRSLDDAALEAVRRAARFPAIPPELGRDSLALSVSLNYSLR